MFTSWLEKVPKYSSQALSDVLTDLGFSGGGGSGGYGDLTGDPTDSATFNALYNPLLARVTANEGDIVTNAGDITAIEALLPGNLTDLSGLSLSSDELLYYDGSNLESLTLGTNLSITAGVLNSTFTPGSVALNDLTDVVISSPALGEVVRYDGSNFENYPLSFSELQDVNITSPADGEFIKYVGGDYVNADLPISTNDDQTQIIGSVTGAGGIGSGTGFTVTKLGTGYYRVNFGTALPSVPTVVATVDGTSVGFRDAVCRVGDRTTLNFLVFTSVTGATESDQPFCFIASAIT